MCQIFIEKAKCMKQENMLEFLGTLILSYLAKTDVICNDYVIILSDEHRRIVFMLYTNLNRIQCQFGKKSFKTQCAHSTRGKTLKKKKRLEEMSSLS